MRTCGRCPGTPHESRGWIRPFWPCDVRFSAFQYALLSALAVLPRNVLGAPAGFLSDEIGWAAFFVVTFFTALPGLAMVWWQRERIAALEHKNQ